MSKPEFFDVRAKFDDSICGCIYAVCSQLPCAERPRRVGDGESGVGMTALAGQVRAETRCSGNLRANDDCSQREHEASARILNGQMLVTDNVLFASEATVMDKTNGHRTIWSSWLSLMTGASNAASLCLNRGRRNLLKSMRYGNTAEGSRDQVVEPVWKVSRWTGVCRKPAPLNAFHGAPPTLSLKFQSHRSYP